MIKCYLILYLLGTCLFIFVLKQVHDFMYEASFDTISCGEALFRANGSAAPRDSREVQMYYECLFAGVKKWPSNYLK